MAVIHLTDLHFGNGGPQDDYVQHPERFERFLADCTEIKDRKAKDPDLFVVITGDLFNGEAGARACIDGDTFREAMSFLRPLRPIICVGNHDSEIHAFKDHPIFKDCIIRDTIIFNDTLFMHGHQIDLACGKWGWIGKTVSRFAHLIGSTNPAWEDALRGSGGSLGNPHTPKKEDADSAFARRAIAYAHKHGCKRVVCGHTHEPPKIGPVYFNAGYYPRDGFMVIDGL